MFMHEQKPVVVLMVLALVASQEVQPVGLMQVRQV